MSEDWDNAETYNEYMNQDIQERLAYESTGVYDRWQEAKLQAPLVLAAMGLAEAFPMAAWFLGMSQAENEGEAAAGALFYPLARGTGTAAGGAGSKAGLSSRSDAATAGANTPRIAEKAGAGAKTGAAAGRASGGVNLASPARTRHVLHGDATGGGHKFGLSRLFNGKTKFPVSWSEQRIMNAVSEVATSPSSVWTQQTGKAGAQLTKSGVPVKWKVEGTFDGLRIRVIVQGDDIVTAHPIK
jgi:hypothetical protein